MFKATSPVKWWLFQLDIVEILDLLYFHLWPLLQSPSVAALLWILMPSGFFFSSSWETALWSWDQVTDLVIEEYSMSWVAFTVFLGSLLMYTVIWHPISHVVFGWRWADIVLHTLGSWSAVILSKKPSVPVWSAAIYIHLITYAQPWCRMLWIISCPFSSPYFFLPITPIKSVSRFHLSKEYNSRTWEAFLDASNLAFLLLNVTKGLQLVLNPLYLHP